MRVNSAGSLVLTILLFVHQFSFLSTGPKTRFSLLFHNLPACSDENSTSRAANFSLGKTWKKMSCFRPVRLNLEHGQFAVIKNRRTVSATFKVSIFIVLSSHAFATLYYEYFSTCASSPISSFNGTKNIRTALKFQKTIWTTLLVFSTIAFLSKTIFHILIFVTIAILPRYVYSYNIWNWNMCQYLTFTDAFCTCCVSSWFN